MAKLQFGSKAAESKGPRYTTASRSFQVSEDIMPIAELKANLSETVRGLETRPRPLVITLNGKPAAVIMSPREFDRLVYQQQVVAAANEGLADHEAGNVHEAEQVFDELEAELADERPRRRKKS